MQVFWFRISVQGHLPVKHASLTSFLDGLVPTPAASLLAQLRSTLGEAFSFSLPEPGIAVVVLSGLAMVVLIISRR
jgi:hypothetical protein